MDDKLKDLAKIMDKAVYQKTRFSQQSKEEVMLMIKKNARIKRKNMITRFQYGMSVAAFTLAFGFLLGIIVGDVQQDDRQTRSDSSAVMEHPVASLPLINRTAQIMKREKDVSYISISKSDHYIQLTFELSGSLSTEQMKQKVNRFLDEATSLSRDVKILQEQGRANKDVWDDYTVDIYVKDVRNVRMKESLFEEAEQYLLKGIKERGSKKVQWTREPNETPPL